MPPPQIVVENLVKTFRVARCRPGTWGALVGLFRRRHREAQALDGVSFVVAPGELVGYFGPDGAGKSTTVKVMAGILVPDAGRCEVRGRVPWRERERHVAEIGVVFGQRTQLWWDLPAVESIDLLRAIYRVPVAAYRRRRDELVALLGLEPRLDTPVRQLSLGQRMRCDLAAALLHAPPILFLDEPTIGLEAPAKLAVRDFVRRIHRERGVTVILTTHDLDDIEALCSRVVVIGEGRILADGSPGEQRRRVSGERWPTIDPADGGELEPVAGSRLVAREGPRVRLGFDPERTPTAAVIAAVTARHAVRDLSVENLPIEQIVARLCAGRGEATPP